eukprot:4298188-Alexandrium_andersonii.AAC.1
MDINIDAEQNGWIRVKHAKHSDIYRCADPPQRPPGRAHQDCRRQLQESAPVSRTRTQGTE